jgi:hypothetical protein
MTQQKIARVKRLDLEARAVTRDEEPMANFISQQFNGAEGGKFTAKLWIGGISALGKNKPNAIVARGFWMVPEHANDAVAQVDGKPGKHAADFGVQGRERFHNERVRRLRFRLRRAGHGL